MAELSTLARPYAKAAFEAARDAKALADWSQALALAAVVSLDDKIQSALSDPSLTAEQKASVFFEVCGDDLNASQKNFLSILAENKRLPLLPQVQELYELYKANQEKTLDVDIQSAFEISDELKEKISKALSKKMDRDVNLKSSVDSTLLGGALIRAGDTVIDASLRGRINKLSEIMKA